MRASFLVAVTAAAGAAVQAAADTTATAPPPRFHVTNVLGHDCVLQRDRDDTLVWGFGTPGLAVKGNVDGAPLACTAVDAAAVWRCTVPRTPASATLHNFSFTQSDGQTAALDRVLFGDVFIIGGQSNAVFALTDSFGGKEAIAAATPARYPLVRLFTVGQSAYPRDPALHPELTHWIQNWTAVSPAAVGGASWTYFSAVGWYFGAALNDILKAAEAGGVPLGLVNNNWGGTLIQEWTPVGALSPACNQSGNPILPMNFSNGDLYGPAVHPYTVGPMQLAGVVWYQAESNIDVVAPGFGGAYYACQLPLTITAWRTALGQPALPWVVVVLAAYTAKSGDDKRILPDMRAGQIAGASSLPGVWFATAADKGDTGSPFTDIHPRLKQPVGARLAAVVAARVYGLTGITAAGPAYASSAVVDAGKPGYAAVAVAFTADSPPVTVNATAGQACPPTYNYTRYCEAFVVVLSDGSEVEVQHDAVAVAPGGRGVVITVPLPARHRSIAAPVPVATRYAYAPWPVTSLYTADGWPATPWSEPITATAAVTAAA